MNEFQTILLCQKLKIFTGHKNITRKFFNTDRILWYIIIVEIYSPEIEYIPAKKNIVADALSKLSNNGNQETTHESTYKIETI